MPLQHRGHVSRRDARGYDRDMTFIRHIAFACFVALPAAAACADPEIPAPTRESAAGGSSMVSPNAPALPGRYSRDAYAPKPAAAGRNAPARGDSPRLRFQASREFSQDLHVAIEQARRAHGGKVLSADRLRRGGRDVYRVKLLTPDGRVRVVQLQRQESPESMPAREQQGEW
jgi:hypothetical protein